MRVPCSQENISGKYLDDQSGENWVTARAQRGHEGEEQSVICQAVYKAYSVQLPNAIMPECQNGDMWLKGVLRSQEIVEWPKERRTAIKAPSN